MSRRLLMLGLCLLTLLGCGRSRVALLDTEPNPQPIYGTKADTFLFSNSDGTVGLTFPTVSSSGIYLDLGIPEGLNVTSETWQGDAHTMHLVAGNGKTTQLGILPLAGYAGEEVSVSIRLSSKGVSVLQPHAFPSNDIFDLSVAELGGGQVRLGWTQVNTGDYDLNGEVNISDMTPLGSHLGDRLDTNVAPYLQRVNWIDGDHNGEINIADLSPLGRYLGNQVGGYIVKRNGVRLGDPTAPFTQSAALGLQRKEQGLPPFHTYVGVGSSSDSWEVQTVNSFGDGNELPGSGGQSSVDVHLHSSIAGVPLLGVHGASATIASDGDCIMRIIDPGDDIDSAEYPGDGERYYPAQGTANFSGLPRGVPLCADIIYVPSLDLATGQQRAAVSGPDGQPYPDAYYVYTRVPFILPPGTATLDIHAQIALTPSGTGGYYVELLAENTINGVMTGRRSKLDFALGQLAYDSDGDGSYADEPLLADSWRTNMSNNLRQSYAARADYASQALASVVGTVSEVDQLNGVLTLGSEATEQTLGGAAVQVSDLSVKFTELTDFHERTTGVGDSDLDVFSTLQAGDQVEIGLSRLVDNAQTPGTLRLADSIVRINETPAADIIYAVPEVQLAYPGQSVRVTVSTSPTAGELRNAKVRITYPASCHYKPKSFNLGAPGGPQWQIDGVWALTNATLFIRPQGDFPEDQDSQLNAIDVEFISDATSGAVGASGALFNFELVANSDANLAFERGTLGTPLTAYFDTGGNTHFWTSDSNAGQPAINVEGERPQLALLSTPPGEGAGTAGSPYLINTPADFQLALYSEGADVSTAPDTVWYASGTDVTIDNGLLHIGAGFEGLLPVTAAYRGLPNSDSSTVYFYVGAPLFNAQIDTAATFANGGGGLGSFSTIMLDHGATVDVQILGSELDGLKALYFDLPFDPAQFAFNYFEGTVALEDADAAYPLVAPSAGRPTPVIFDTDNKAHVRFGMAMARPAQTLGFSGGGPLVTLHFFRQPGTYGPRQYDPPIGTANTATIKQSGKFIQWDYYNQGDANQNGTVEYSDFNLIAQRFSAIGDPPPPDGTLDDVIDCNNDGVIDLVDAATAEEAIDRRVEVYHVYGGTYPVGTQFATVSFSEAQGQGQGIRLYFELDVSAEPYTMYWVKPVAGGVEGQISNACFYIPE